jgi:prophage regulatory protein
MPRSSNKPELPKARIVRVREIVKRTGMSRSTLSRQVKLGKFPSPFRLTETTLGWMESEVEEWIMQRSAKRLPRDENPNAEIEDRLALRQRLGA